MAHDDAERIGADGPRGLHEIERRQRLHFGPHDTRGFHPSGGGDQQDQHGYARLQDGGAEHQQREARNGEHRVGGAHEGVVDPAASVSGHRADRDADSRAHECRQHADGERNAGSHQHTREDVAPEFIGAEPVQQRRRGATVGQIECIGGEGREIRGQQRRYHERGEKEQTTARSGLHAAPRVRGSMDRTAISASRLRTITAMAPHMRKAMRTG